MAEKLAGKRILVTGGGVRIGRAVAVRLAENGASVVVHCNRSLEQARELVAKLRASTSGNHEVVQADLCDQNQVQRLIPSLLAADQPLHGLINNASVYRRKPLLDTDSEDFLLNYTINFWSPFLLMRDFARFCKKGCVINLLDQRVAKVEPSAGLYAFAKKSLRDATEAAALEWAPSIRVNGVAPGFSLAPPGVDENKMKPLLANVPMQCASGPDEIADACLYLLTAKTVTGQVLYVDGGMHLAPQIRSEVSEADYGL